MKKSSQESSVVEDTNPKNMPVRNFIAGISLYSLGYAALVTSPYLQKMIGGPVFGYSDQSDSFHRFLTQIFDLTLRSPAVGLRAIYVFYVVRMVIELFVSPYAHMQPERPYRFWMSLGKIIKNNARFLRGTSGVPEKPSLTKDELVNMLYFLLKFFYFPMMFGVLFANVNNVINYFQSPMPEPDNWKGVQQILYLRTLNSLFFVDVAVFVFGYLFEIPGKSKIRSVEHTAFGWMVALMCYPPFNGVVAGFMPSQIPDFTFFFDNQVLTGIGLSTCILLYVIYVWASVALGFKASNLTNRGIVARGPYAIVRHPAYITKNAAWLIMALPMILTGSLAALFTILFWNFVYFLRAMTEERHLLEDPDYVEYCKKVRYRFIPGVY